MTNLILLFIIYGLLGWCVEVLYVFALSGRLYNRGFLHMPFLPIYAVGGIFITLALNPIYGPLNVYILGVVYTSILEYITSVVMERFFHTRWWDYSNIKFNVHGRICLRNSLLFGILGLIVIYGLNPIFEQLIISIPTAIKSSIINIFLIIFIFDLYITLHKVSNLPIRDIRIISGKVKAYQQGKLKEIDQLLTELDDLKLKHEIFEFTHNISNRFKSQKWFLLILSITAIIGLFTHSLIFIQIIIIIAILIMFAYIYNRRHK